MTTYIFKRILMLIPLMLGITLITFTVIHLAPGEPVEMQVAMNPKVGKDARERELSDRLQAFFESKGMAAYGCQFTLDGRRYLSEVSVREMTRIPSLVNDVLRSSSIESSLRYRSQRTKRTT